jgi:predicted dehydrogenase
MSNPVSATRREFLKSSATVTGAAAFGSLLAAQVAQGVHTGVNETLRIGLVGCGSRGTGAVLDALQADKQATLVAVGDVFRDQAERSVRQLHQDKECGSRVQVDAEHIFTDFDSYRSVIDACDVVLLATPTHFRPQHLHYAVQQGKHAFVEKPIAVDAPGVRSVQESCRLAEEKGLSIVSGLCWRYYPGVLETMRKILDEKLIGEIVAIESSYNGNTLWHRGDKPDWSRMEYQIRNWPYFTWLSGDHTVEQAVHSLDKAAWLLGDIQPTQAMALGGRQQRTAEKFGNVYDHFTVFYEFPTGQHVYFTCRQQANTTTRVDDRVLGTSGQAEILKHTVTPKNGQPWTYTGETPSMYVEEHKALFQSIRDGKPLNNGHYMCNSTMIGIMGRMAAYSGQTLTWEECINSEDRLGPTEYAWTDEVPLDEVSIPGRKRKAQKSEVAKAGRNS